MGEIECYKKIQQRFFWLLLFHDVDSYCHSYPECQKISTPRHQRVPLIPLPVMKDLLRGWQSILWDHYLAAVRVINMC